MTRRRNRRRSSSQRLTKRRNQSQQSESVSATFFGIKLKKIAPIILALESVAAVAAIWFFIVYIIESPERQEERKLRKLNTIQSAFQTIENGYGKKYDLGQTAALELLIDNTSLQSVSFPGVSFENFEIKDRQQTINTTASNFPSLALTRADITNNLFSANPKNMPFGYNVNNSERNWFVEQSNIHRGPRLQNVVLLESTLFSVFTDPEYVYPLISHGFIFDSEVSLINRKAGYYRDYNDDNFSYPHSIIERTDVVDSIIQLEVDDEMSLRVARNLRLKNSSLALAPSRTGYGKEDIYAVEYCNICGDERSRVRGVEKLETCEELEATGAEFLDYSRFEEKFGDRYEYFSSQFNKTAQIKTYFNKFCKLVRFVNNEHDKGVDQCFYDYYENGHLLTDKDKAPQEVRKLLFGDVEEFLTVFTKEREDVLQAYIHKFGKGNAPQNRSVAEQVVADIGSWAEDSATRGAPYFIAGSKFKVLKISVNEYVIIPTDSSYEPVQLGLSYMPASINSMGMDRSTLRRYYECEKSVSEVVNEHNASLLRLTRP